MMRFLGKTGGGRASLRIPAVVLVAGLTPLALACAPALADDAAVAAEASEAFADNCFSPFMTAERAQRVLAPTGARVDFYDLQPFSDAEISPVVGRAATPDTDRRCEVAFDGDFADMAAEAAVQGLRQERIQTEVPLPQGFAATPTTAVIGARALNPRRIAVVHVGTRPGPNGVETFMFVERLTEEASTR